MMIHYWWSFRFATLWLLGGRRERQGRPRLAVDSDKTSNHLHQLEPWGTKQWSWTRALFTGTYVYHLAQNHIYIVNMTRPYDVSAVKWLDMSWGKVRTSVTTWQFHYYDYWLSDETTMKILVCKRQTIKQINLTVSDVVGVWMEMERRSVQLSKRLFYLSKNCTGDLLNNQTL